MAVVRHIRHMRPAACIIAAVPKLVRAILGLRIGARMGNNVSRWPASGALRPSATSLDRGARSGSDHPRLFLKKKTESDLTRSSSQRLGGTRKAKVPRRPLTMCIALSLNYEASPPLIPVATPATILVAVSVVRGKAAKAGDKGQPGPRDQKGERGEPGPSGKRASGDPLGPSARLAPRQIDAARYAAVPILSARRARRLKSASPYAQTCLAGSSWQIRA